MSIEVLKPGLWSSIQDRGRRGYANYGVPASGAMDAYAAGFANSVVGNSLDKAVMEITIQGPKLLFHSTCVVAVAAREAVVEVNARAVEINTPLALKKGDELEVKIVSKGRLAYLSVKFGFQTEEILNSRSMFPSISSKSKIEKGDVLPIRFKEQKLVKKLAKVHFREEDYGQLIEVSAGPEFPALSIASKELLQKQCFSLSADSNRQAYVLNEQVENDLQNILTCAVMPGTVQLTPSGTLIVLMRDCQVSGGYPRVLQLPDKSINHLTQMGPELFAFKMI